jgi:hypothetical protein
VCAGAAPPSAVAARHVAAPPARWPRDRVRVAVRRHPPPPRAPSTRRGPSTEHTAAAAVVGVAALLLHAHLTQFAEQRALGLGRRLLQRRAQRTQPSQLFPHLLQGTRPRHTVHRQFIFVGHPRAVCADGCGARRVLQCARAQSTSIGGWRRTFGLERNVVSKNLTWSLKNIEGVKKKTRPLASRSQHSRGHTSGWAFLLELKERSTPRARRT